RCAYVTVDAEPRREAVAGVGQDQVDRVGEVETRPELDLGVADTGATAARELVFDRGPVRRVVDMADDVEIGRAQRPRAARGVDGRSCVAESRGGPAALGRRAS